MSWDNFALVVWIKLHLNTSRVDKKISAPVKCYSNNVLSIFSSTTPPNLNILHSSCLLTCWTCLTSFYTKNYAFACWSFRTDRASWCWRRCRECCCFSDFLLVYAQLTTNMCSICCLSMVTHTHFKPSMVHSLFEKYFLKHTMHPLHSSLQGGALCTL